MNPQVNSITENPSNDISEKYNGMIRPYINDNLNSRINVKLPDGVWKVKWRSQFLKGLNPAFILQYKDRILAQGPDTWELFDIDGKQLIANSYGNSDVVIDPSNLLIYCSDKNSILHAFSLNDGQVAFILDDLYGVNYNRNFITRFDSVFIVLSNEQILDPHSSDKPEITYIEKQNIGTNQHIDYLKILDTSKREKLEKRESGNALAAATGEVFVVAYENHIEFMDKSLSVIRSFKGKFVPVSMSIDSNAWVYIIVISEDKRNLIILDPNGNKINEFSLPLTDNYKPPVVGFNNEVYVNLNNRIMAFSPQSGLIWEQYTNKISGMVILPDNSLLVSEGEYIFAFDNKGSRKYIRDFQNGPLLTAPFISEKGEIFVADNTFLYCLTTK